MILTVSFQSQEMHGYDWTEPQIWNAKELTKSESEYPGNENLNAYRRLQRSEELVNCRLRKGDTMLKYYMELIFKYSSKIQVIYWNNRELSST